MKKILSLFICAAFSILIVSAQETTPEEKTSKEKAPKEKAEKPAKEEKATKEKTEKPVKEKAPKEDTFAGVPVKKRVRFEKGQRSQNLFLFDKAIKHYSKFYEKNPNNFRVSSKLADVFRITGQYENALEWYGRIIQMPEAKPVHHYYYAQSLRNLGRYEEAKAHYEKFIALDAEDPRGTDILSGLNNMHPFFKDSAMYYIESLEINSPNADFSPAFFRNKSLAFPSARGSGKIDERWSGQPFLDLFFAEYDSSKNAFSTPQQFKGKVASKYHEGPLAFDSTFTKVVFTRNNLVKRPKKSKDNIIKLNLFQANISGEEMSNIERINFNSTEYSCGHPTLSSDGRFMIFASDMPGGKGGQDLYYTEFDGALWSEPVNLSDAINTPGDEVFPFLHEDGTLYFASDARAGLGGLDIYKAAKTGDKQWANPTNLGYPINTQYDDFGFIQNKEKTLGYFSSNRPGGKGDDDIYYFDNQRFFINILVYDRLTNKPIEAATVKQVVKEDTLQTTRSNESGMVEMKVKYGSEFDLRATRTDYRPRTVSVKTDGMTPKDTVKIGMGLILEITVINAKTSAPLPGSIVNSLLKEKDLVQTDTANAQGKVFVYVKTDGNYRLSADKFGFFLTEPVELNTANIAETVDTHRVRLELNYLGAGEIIVLKNIYYDYDKFNIRPDAASELDRLIEIMKKYPAMKIEMRSHTDSRGSDSYNEKLSDNRAKSAAQYIISKGIAKNRLTFKGYGEKVPVNKCVNDVPCSEEEHQMNRRTEFKVLVQPDGMEVQGTINN